MTDRNDARLLDLPYAYWQWVPQTGELVIDNQGAEREDCILTVKEHCAHLPGWEKLLPKDKANQLETDLLSRLAASRDVHMRLHFHGFSGPRNLILHGIAAEQHADGSPRRIVGLCRLESGESGDADARSAFDSNKLEERRKMEALLHTAQRFEETARLAGSIAHDLNNLLAPIRMATELLHRQISDNSVDRYIGIIDDSTSRARSVIQQILAFSKTSEKGDLQEVDIHQVLREIEQMVRATFPQRIRKEFDYGASIPKILMDPTQLHQAVLNILINGRDAIEGDGTLSVCTSLKEVDVEIRASGRSLLPGHYACISISDTGCGIAEDIKEQIFDPFFTTKPKEQGTGLALASVFGIVARGGGIIDVESVPGKGSTFHIYLPEASA